MGSYFLTKESVLPGEGAAKPSDSRLACSNFILLRGCELQHVLNLPMHSKPAAGRLGSWFRCMSATLQALGRKGATICPKWRL